MIARMWSGRARRGCDEAYVAHLAERTLPELAAIPGHRGAYVLRRVAGGTVEFTVVTLWDSVDAIVAFAGPDARRAVVPPEARALLDAWDDRAGHWDVVLQTGRT